MYRAVGDRGILTRCAGALYRASVIEDMLTKGAAAIVPRRRSEWAITQARLNSPLLPLKNLLEEQGFTVHCRHHPMFTHMFGHKGNAVLCAYWERPLDYLQLDVGVRLDACPEWMVCQLYGIPFESIPLNLVADPEESQCFMHGYEDEWGPAKDRVERACEFLAGNGSWILEPDDERLREAVQVHGRS